MAMEKSSDQVSMGGCYTGFIRISLCKGRKLPEEFIQIAGVFVAAADSCAGSVGQSRKLKVQISNDLSSPFRMTILPFP